MNERITFSGLARFTAVLAALAFALAWVSTHGDIHEANCADKPSAYQLSAVLKWDYPDGTPRHLPPPALGETQRICPVRPIPLDMLLTGFVAMDLAVMCWYWHRHRIAA